MTTFTNDELYEIEKVFDCIASNIVSKNKVAFLTIAENNEKKEIVKKILDEDLNTFNMFIEISAKAKLMRKND